MIHQRQRLPLRLKAADDLPAVHSRLEDLERHLAADRLLLLGHEDPAEAALADLLEQLVGTDDRPWALACGQLDGRVDIAQLGPACGGRFDAAGKLLMVRG